MNSNFCLNHYLLYCILLKIKIINFLKFFNNTSKIGGDWGLGIGDWGFGVWGGGPNPQTPNTQPQTPTPTKKKKN